VDRRTDVSNLVATVRNIANASKNVKKAHKRDASLS
jgi:hypothetical protein